MFKPMLAYEFDGFDQGARPIAQQEPVHRMMDIGFETRSVHPHRFKFDPVFQFQRIARFEYNFRGHVSKFNNLI